MESQLPLFDAPTFGGSTFCPERDGERLSGALGRTYELMADGRWRTLQKIAEAVGCTEAGASARLRDLRKDGVQSKYPNRGVEREFVERGLWRYRLITNQ
jgi:hypothetical protein